MDIKQIISIRSKVISQLFEEDDAPEDIVFFEKNGKIGNLLVPYKGDFPPTYKYNVRKQVLDKIVKGNLSSTLLGSNDIIFCSIDTVLNVDYCFQITPSNGNTTLYIVQNSAIVRRYQNYDITYDERKDISNINNNTNMIDRIKKLFRKEKPSFETKSQSVDNFSKIRSSGKGCEVIKITLDALIKEMSTRYPEWDGLFEVTTNEKDAVVVCLKGFNDPTTMKAIPYLWRRKSFIENCKLFGVPKIVFLDKTNNTCDWIEVDSIDENSLS
jgi:hypothetical protein